MKKMFLTMALAIVTMFASAQFMVVSDVSQPADDEQWSMSNFTDNLGIGYQLNDMITLGMSKNGEEYDMWGRYNMNSMYLSVKAPATDTTASMMIGVGYSLKVWNNLYVEPNYSMPMKEDSEGVLRFSIAYRF